MRIALVTQHYPPHFEGGTEAVVRGQARELASLGHEVWIVSGTDRPHTGQRRTEETVDGLPVYFLPRRADEAYDLILERTRLVREVETLCAEAQLVHVHHWTTLDNSLVRSLGAGGRPVVLSLHDHFTSCPRFFRIPVEPVEACPEPGDVEPCVRCIQVDAPLPPDELRAGLMARGRIFGSELAAAARLIAPSRAHAARLEHHLSLARGSVEVVPNGLATAVGRAPAPESGRPLRVLHLGHRSRVKGTLDLVRAAAALPAARRAEVELCFLGSEVEPGFDQSLREAAEGCLLRFGGAYDVRALSTILAELGGAHVAAFPSHAYESYGLVVDEALALGLPCLVSDRGALPERLGGAGRALPAADPAAWTAALIELLDQPDLLRAWRAALPAQVPGAAAAAARLERLYQQLLAPTP
ncbi:MAG: glycosyltransferase [Planctomycetota bacterium]